MTLFSYKKLISFLTLFFVISQYSISAEELLTKAEILRKSNECFKNFQNNVCSNLLSELEKKQLVESKQNRYKCQVSFLGLQTELIEAYFFKKLKKNKEGIMISYVIKNC